ncbi:MAG: amidohydrolase family protein [Oscillospiraceae bacterium]|jgi:imidazolonepropionase-like amidohydrolase|nr:amidohydrolase family protein [Oscillospiraceae bacterium]
MSRICYKNARIFIGNDSAAVEDGVLIFETLPDKPRGKVVYAGAADDPKAAGLAESCYKEYELRGYTIMPGLINCHVHLSLSFPFLPYKADPYEGTPYRTLVEYRRLAEALMSGVTTVRSTGCADYIDVALRRAVERNLLFGSRVVACGDVVIAHAGHGFNQFGSCECSGAAEFRRGARAQLAHGADFIKICMTGGLAGPTEGVGDIQMTDDEIEAVVAVAHGSGKIVAAHLSNDASIKAAIRCGVDCVEHGYFMSRETAQRMAAEGRFYVPTIAVSNCGEYLIKHGSPEYHVRKQAEAEARHKQALRNAVEEGVIIGVGTDLLPNDPLGGTTATIREVECLVDAGMTPRQALCAATSVSARILGIDGETGTLAEGMDADFIAVRGKPDVSITELRNIDLVAKGGRLAFSNVAGHEAPGFNVTAPGFALDGASMLRWY